MSARRPIGIAPGVEWIMWTTASSTAGAAFAGFSRDLQDIGARAPDHRRDLFSPLFGLSAGCFPILLRTGTISRSFSRARRARVCASTPAWRPPPRQPSHAAKLRDTS